MSPLGDSGWGTVGGWTVKTLSPLQPVGLDSVTETYQDTLALQRFLEEVEGTLACCFDRC